MRYVLIATCMATISVAAAAGKPAQDNAATPEFYTTKVQPIFQTHCYRCHGAGNHRGRLAIDTRAELLKGGHHGPAIISGDPANSLLVTLIRQEGAKGSATPMPPPPRPKLSSDEITTIEDWIKAGAVMPADASKP